MSRVRLRIIADIVLVVGLGASILSFLYSEEPKTEAIIDAYEHSKAYRRDLELYGGKLNLLSSDLISWLQGLWHGRNLGITLGCITVSFYLLTRYLLMKLPGHDDSSGVENKH